METYNRNAGNVDPVSTRKPKDPNRIGQLLAGLFVVGIGVLLLARQAGMDFPRWIFSFESILIAVGLYLGIRHSFRGVVWLIPVLIGGFLLLDDLYPEFDIEDFTWPLIIIGIGLFIMFRATKKKLTGKSGKRMLRSMKTFPTRYWTQPLSSEEPRKISSQRISGVERR